MSLEKYRPSIVKPEDMKINTPYAITINPNDNFQYIGLTTVQRLKTFRNTQEIFLERLFSPNSIYKFNIEVSAKGRLHLHGVIKVKDIQSFYVFAIPQLLTKSMVEIDTLNDRTIWDRYCTKQNDLHLGSIVTGASPLEKGGIYKFLKSQEAENNEELINNEVDAPPAAEVLSDSFRDGKNSEIL